MNYEELVGRDLLIITKVIHAQLQATQELASFENIQRVLARTQLSDYEPAQTVRGLERCADELLEFRRILFYRIALSKPAYASERLAEVCAALHDVLSQENEPARPEPLPRVDARSLTPESFHELFVRRPRPIIVDNWGFETERLQLNQLVERYGDEPQVLIRPDTSQYEGPLRDLVEKDAYLANSERLLGLHPELIDDLRVGEFEKFHGFKYLTSQLFLGNAFSGSAAHFAIAPNLFLQVEGSKKWTIVDPAFSYLTYPHLNVIDGHTALYWLDEDDAKRCPLFRFCPRYEVSLEPGDALFNPRYWLHSVVNLSKRSVGVASRWMDKPTEGAQSPCALFDVALRLNPRRMEIDLEIVQEAFGDEPAAWLESRSHGRSYQYDPESIARSWGVRSAVVGQAPRFR